jgi:hypothetical protein
MSPRFTMYEPKSSVNFRQNYKHGVVEGVEGRQWWMGEYQGQV